LKNSFYQYLILLLACPVELQAQQPYIFSNDPFSGISAVGISPTQPFLNPNYWDVHLFSEDIFLQNRYAYVSKSSIFSLLAGKVESADIGNNITGENTAGIFDYFNHQRTGYHFSSELMGPSTAIRFSIGESEKEFLVGVFSKLRTQSQIIETDNYLQFTNQELDEPALYDLAEFEFDFVNWTELGLNLATEILPFSDYHWTLGVNLKYLMGNDAVYVQNKDHALMRREFVINPNDSMLLDKNLFVSNFDVEVAYATGFDFENNQYRYKSNGSGFGLDAGIAFVNYGGIEDGYDFKAAFNILDVGYIKFNGFVHRFIGENLQYTNNPVFDETEFQDAEQYAQLISNEIYGNPNQSLISNQFKIGLPTSLHFNISKNIAENQYLSMDLIQRLPLFEHSLRRNNLLNLSYLYSKHQFAIGGSFSVYDYREIQFGGFLRYGPFVIGSENVLPFLIPQKRFHAMDFYIGFKIYPYQNRDMERRSRCKC